MNLAFLNSNSKCSFWNWDTEECELNFKIPCSKCEHHTEEGTKSAEELEEIKGKILEGNYENNSKMGNAK